MGLKKLYISYLELFNELGLSSYQGFTEKNKFIAAQGKTKWIKSSWIISFMSPKFIFSDKNVFFDSQVQKKTP